MAREIEYCISRAEGQDARIVTLGGLVLFSTETGDAWMLDAEDGLALCLARAGERRPFTVAETPTSYSIQWEASFRIDGDRFIIIEEPGQVQFILGYPTRQILQALRRER